MTKDDRIPPLPRLLLAAARRGLEPSTAASFEVLAEALARGLPLRRLPAAVLRLRRHLGGGAADRARADGPQKAGASSSAGRRR